jgi:hypothetical protein
MLLMRQLVTPKMFLSRKLIKMNMKCFICVFLLIGLLSCGDSQKEKEIARKKAYDDSISTVLRLQKEALEIEKKDHIKKAKDIMQWAWNNDNHLWDFDRQGAKWAKFIHDQYRDHNENINNISWFINNEEFMLELYKKAFIEDSSKHSGNEFVQMFERNKGQIESDEEFRRQIIRALKEDMYKNR